MSDISYQTDHEEWLKKLVKIHPDLCGEAMLEGSRGYLFPVGWRAEIECLLDEISKQSPRPQEVLQIKEKIGVAHVNLLTRITVLTGLIEAARFRLSSVCGSCGSQASTRPYEPPMCDVCQSAEGNRLEHS